jgi:hypothetical protein
VVYEMILANDFFSCQLNEVQSSNLIEFGGVYNNWGLQDEFFFAAIGT